MTIRYKPIILSKQPTNYVKIYIIHQINFCWKETTQKRMKRIHIVRYEAQTGGTTCRHILLAYSCYSWPQGSHKKGLSFSLSFPGFPDMKCNFPEYIYTRIHALTLSFKCDLYILNFPTQTKN